MKAAEWRACRDKACAQKFMSKSVSATRPTRTKACGSHASTPAATNATISCLTACPDFFHSCLQAIKWAESQEAANAQLKYGMMPGSSNAQYGSPSASLLAAIH